MQKVPHVYALKVEMVEKFGNLKILPLLPLGVLNTTTHLSPVTMGPEIMVDPPGKEYVPNVEANCVSKHLNLSLVKITEYIMFCLLSIIVFIV
jgi:hypothetical protein